MYDVQQISKEVKTLESLISKKPKNKKGKGIWREMYYQRIILHWRFRPAPIIKTSGIACLIYLLRAWYLRKFSSYGSWSSWKFLSLLYPRASLLEDKEILPSKKSNRELFLEVCKMKTKNPMPDGYISRLESKEWECWKLLDWRLNSENDSRLHGQPFLFLSYTINLFQHYHYILSSIVWCWIYCISRC